MLLTLLLLTIKYLKR